MIGNSGNFGILRGALTTHIINKKNQNKIVMLKIINDQPL